MKSVQGRNLSLTVKAFQPKQNIFSKGSIADFLNTNLSLKIQTLGHWLIQISTFLLRK